MKSSAKMALGGMMTALGVLFMFLTGLFPLADYALPALAGILTVVVVIEISDKTAWCVYAAISILSLLVVPRLEAKLVFIAFLGYYPIVKAYLERIKSRAVSWASKFALFNAAAAVIFTGMSFLLGLDALLAEFDGYGAWGLAAFWAFANLVFWIYDIALTRVISMYLSVVRPKVRPFMSKRR